jgi:hypothetical protein
MVFDCTKMRDDDCSIVINGDITSFRDGANHQHNHLILFQNSLLLLKGKIDLIITISNKTTSNHFLFG